MTGKINTSNKKIIIATVIAIAVLLILAITGTVVFLNDKGSAEATEMIDNHETNQISVNSGETTEKENQEIQPEENEINENKTQNEVISNEQIQNSIVGTRNDATISNIQSSTIQTTETVTIGEEQKTEEHYVWWTPMELNVNLNSAEHISAEKDDLKIEKAYETEKGNDTVTPGEVITYKIAITNNSKRVLTGIEVKDKIPELTRYVKESSNPEAKEFIGKDNEVTTLKWNIDLNIDEQKEIIFKVKVLDTATGTIYNTAVVNGENTNQTETKIMVPKVDIIPTVVEKQTIYKPQKAILVLDFSNSMKGKIDQLKKAVNDFIDEFMKVNTENQIMLIEYDKGIINETPYGYTNNKEELKAKLKDDKTGSGTNIDYALTKANEMIVTEEDITTTSVILMTDGTPYYYYDENEGTISCDSRKGKEEARNAAEKIAKKGVKLYAVGFNYYEGNEVSGLMKDIAKLNGGDLTEEEKIERYYSEPSNGTALKFAFKNIAQSITTTHDGEPIELTAKEGRITIETEMFKEAQKVEIYKGTFLSTPIATYSLEGFKNLEYQSEKTEGAVEKLKYIEETENGSLLFNIEQYMKDNKIELDEKIIIRFVGPQIEDNKMASLETVALPINVSDEAVNGEIEEIKQTIDEKTVNEDIIGEEKKVDEVENKNAETVKEQEVENLDKTDSKSEKADDENTENSSSINEEMPETIEAPISTTIEDNEDNQ